MDRNIDKILEKSKGRVEDIDSKRKWIDNTEGRIEPNIETMLLGEAKKFKLAVLHVDINGFKELTNNLSNEEYRRFVSIFLTEMTQIILDHDGYIDRYIGDQVTALFGIVHDCEECKGSHNCDNCSLGSAWGCAKDIILIIDKVLNNYLQSINLPSFTCSIGIDFGEIWICKVGIKGNNQFTLIGGAVNKAAQALELANPTEVVVGKNFFESLPSDFRKFFEPIVSPSHDYDFFKLLMAGKIANEQ